MANLKARYRQWRASSMHSVEETEKHTCMTAAVPDEVYQSWIDELESLPLKQRNNGRLRLTGVTVVHRQFDLNKGMVSMHIISTNVSFVHRFLSVMNSVKQT